MSIYNQIFRLIVASIVGVIIVVDFAMGILARTVPQMNMFVIGIPLKMIILFILLIGTIHTTSKYNDIIIEGIVNTLSNVIQGMRGLWFH